MAYYAPDIIDNSRADRTLSHHLTQAIIAGDQQRLDIATGYFSPDVWHLVGAALEHLHLFRLLVGVKPNVGYGVDATLDLRQMFRHTLAQDIAEMGFDREHARLVDELVQFLQRDDVAVRHFDKKFLHAKAYIFDRISFVGSNNFTPPGLTHNSELAVANMNEASVERLRAWFESKWALGIDSKADLIETLQASKFGTKTYTPFEVFIKALYEYFKDRLVLDADRQTAVELARFQEEGKLEAINLLDKWGGVLVADAVGLGKTFIGLSLLEHELLSKRRRGHVPRALVICPAQLRDLVWRPRIQQFGIPGVEIRSQEELGNKDFDWRGYARTVDVVLVDESHNFRNPNTNRADHLLRLVSTGRKKRVVLMTATPVNNSIFDLYQQIRYLTRGNDYHYRALGIANLKGYFKAAQHAGLDIFELLEATTVRRSRSDIRRRQDAGDAVVVNGQPVHFPERRLARIDYDLDQTYQGFYPDIVADIEGLHLVAYNVQEYARTPNQQTRQAAQANTALIALMKMLYLKRLESSVAAFSSSIHRQRDFQRQFLTLLQKGKLLDAASYRKMILVDTDDDNDGEQMQELIDLLPAANANQFAMERITKLVAEDVATLETLAGRIDTVFQHTAATSDAKLIQVKDLLAGPLRGKKVLIFTSYHDTANYLFRQLRDDSAWCARADEPVIEIITGGTKGDERERLVQRFAPRANQPNPTNGQRTMD
nr:helicase [Ktedonobacterales bacterium]